MDHYNYSYSNNGNYVFRYLKRNSSRNINIPNLPDGYRVQNDNLNKGYSTKGISHATRRKIIKHARVLGISAKPQRVRNNKGNYIYHRVMFITLTLPSPQKHTDQEITNTILQHFLDRGRKLGIFANYVWRAEKQKNGNIHYHLITDSYVSYSLIYRLWLLSLEKLDYVKRYTKKFSSMPYEVYSRLPFNKNQDIRIVSERYAKGVRNFWKKPPCVDVRSTDSLSQINDYIAKYAGKNEEDADNIVTGRVWACSRSVSAATKSFCTDQELNSFWFNIGQCVMKREVIRHEYFDMCLFSFVSISAWFPDFSRYVQELMSIHITPCTYYARMMGISS